jgi:hypothetical protein
MQIAQIPKISFLFSIILGLNLLSYTVQPYIPPSGKHSLSYTVENCPSHKNRNPVSRLIQVFIKSDKDEGSQKHCFCSTCNIERSSFIVVKSSVNLIMHEYLTCLLPSENKPYLQDLISSLFIRSPPILVS